MGHNRAGDELRSLRDWLDREAALRGRVELVHTPGNPGDVGGLADLTMLIPV